MIYIIYGNKYFLVNKEIKNIKNSFDTNSISYYDLENDNIDDIINDAETISLFDDKKLIICYNSIIFNSNGINTKNLETYLNNFNPNTTIIFTLNSDKLDKRKKITKIVLEKGKVIEYNENINTFSFIKNSLKNYNISDDNINLIKQRVGDNIDLVNSELEKIKIYKNKDKNITKEDILNLTHKNIEIDIFKLIDYIVSSNKDKALEMYDEMIKVNEEPIKILIMLANQFRLMYQVKEFVKMGYTQKDIATTLSIHPYRVKIALQNGQNYDSNTLLNYLKELADIDINIKTGKIDKNLALELFILKK